MFRSDPAGQFTHRPLVWLKYGYATGHPMQVVPLKYGVAVGQYTAVPTGVAGLMIDVVLPGLLAL